MKLEEEEGEGDNGIEDQQQFDQFVPEEEEEEDSDEEEDSEDEDMFSDESSDSDLEPDDASLQVQVSCR